MGLVSTESLTSQEGGTSKAYLFGQLSALESPIASTGVAAPAQPAQLKPPASQVPEPTTIAGSLLGLLFAIRYRKKHSQA
ncbi:PEP-CTERM sorting domain-containing protein [Phormidium sp. CCY1219]|uniref:PEP-CTERM sorting domain-containing protein n=1 Tax=Phormidium sp. CCY1219 TaxID=2886104 RepID=UPI002D1ECAD0|nr:PEP-CTERM sorting domain-containing protein [Phormidium sp. CCY1219]MEB3827101.1 PEP-CTERM sorting domain-containing protein [Phormidium sp. CCY1219]